MPKKGFKSFTLHEEIYDIYYSKFKKNKNELAIRGITSLSAYVAYILHQSMSVPNVLSNPRFEIIFSDLNLVVLKDKLKNQIIEIAIKKNTLYCQLDKRSDCMHVGFAYSLNDVLEKLNK